MSQKRKRTWATNHRRTTFLPEELLIAGHDFEADHDDPLRDEPSEGRKRKDVKLLASLRERGFLNVILITARTIAGELRPVVAEGRSRVRLSRQINKERVEQGEDPLSWTVEYKPTEGGKNKMTALELFTMARVLNRDQAPETHAQKARYFVRLVDLIMKEDPEVSEIDKPKRRQSVAQKIAIKILGEPKANIPHFKAVAADQCATWVYEALDIGDLGLQSAATIAKLHPTEQTRIKEALEGKKMTTGAVREAVAGERGTKAAVGPSKKRVRAILDKKDEIKLPDDFWRGVLFMLGELKLADIPELAEHWDK